MSVTQLMERIEERIRDWNVNVQRTLETQSSFLAFGTRGNQPVVLKVLRHPGDEWRCGEVLDAFDGRGMVRYNILFDNDRGWIAVDPKGVIGEIEYEIGASLRNPFEKPGIFASAQAVERRLKRYESKLQSH